MSRFVMSNPTNGPQTQVDLSEEARMAQLRRIEELKVQIGDSPAWSSHKSSGHLAYSTSRENKALLMATESNSITASCVFKGAASSGHHVNHQLVDHQFIETATNGSNGSSKSYADYEAEEVLCMPQYPISSSCSSMDISEDTSQLGGAASLQSKATGLSSHTSRDTLDTKIKVEDDELVMLDDSHEKSAMVSPLSSALSPAKSVTPAPLQPHPEASAPKRRRISSKLSKLRFADLRARTSIPSDILHEELARQSVEAAVSSRLNPFCLHPSEYQLLRRHICHLHVSAYISIRNRILRLWVQNPLVSVTPEEAAGCSYSSRWLGLAEVAYEWLVRRGYINFGCVEVPDMTLTACRVPKTKGRGKTIVVVGAGMSGLGCARQLEGLFNHYRERWVSQGEEPPRVIVLEGRKRIGGRIYSHPLHGQKSTGIPIQARCTAEMGAHIITGFDHGNPLNMIVRGQLALHYYPLKDNSSLYDIDGKIVDRRRDRMTENLFNDILERASAYRHELPVPKTVQGDRSLIEAGRDPTGDEGKSISEVEEEHNEPAGSITDPDKRRSDQLPAGIDKLTGKAHMVVGSRTKATPALAAEAMGWRLVSHDRAQRDLDLDKIAHSTEWPTLGQAMDEGVKQYQSLLALSAQDLRLINWHFANLEYANAASVGKLSLGGWDQDIGNEFEGEHAQVIGGYIQVPRGLWQYPTQLDLRPQKPVSHIAYRSDPSQSITKTEVICENGEVIEADQVVLTTPLGVLKDRSITFEPELPTWKLESINRLGFGTLNKVILVFEKPFWDVEQDMIGLLRDTPIPGSDDQDDYSTNRGRFYLFWNCIKTTGRPLLIALMAGDAAHQAEALTDGEIVAEVTEQLAKMFKQKQSPQPSEVIITRWGKDRFARGSYSYVGQTAHSDDYDAMARPVGNLHFAGEATCGTHPATVHGAYISGLRAASEIIDELIGPIAIPHPLVPPAVVKAEPIAKDGQVPPLRADALPAGESIGEKQARLERFEHEILSVIFTRLGPRPDKPGKAGANPFLLFSKDKWAECKAKCDRQRQAVVGSPTAKASRNEVRTALGLMWREASDEVKRPYIDQTLENRASNKESKLNFQERLDMWDAEAMTIRREYVKGHPGVLSKEEEGDMWQALGVFAGQERKAKKMSGYADSDKEGEQEQEQGEEEGPVLALSV